jgi:hypothetical protein
MLDNVSSLSPAAPAWSSDDLARALLSITAQLGTCPPVPQATRFVLEELLALTRARSGWAHLPGGVQLTCSAGDDAVPPDAARLAAWNRFVIRTGRPVLDRHPAASPVQLTDVVALPLRHEETVFGVIGLVGCPPCSLSGLAGLEALLFPLAFRLAHGPCGGPTPGALIDLVHNLQGQVDGLLRPGAAAHPAALRPVLHSMAQQLIRLRAMLDVQKMPACR